MTAGAEDLDWFTARIAHQRERFGDVALDERYRDARYTVAEPMQRARSPRISGSALGRLAAVHFDNEPHARCDEVKGVELAATLTKHPLPLKTASRVGCP